MQQTPRKDVWYAITKRSEPGVEHMIELFAANPGPNRFSTEHLQLGHTTQSHRTQMLKEKLRAFRDEQSRTGTLAGIPYISFRGDLVSPPEDRSLWPELVGMVARVPTETFAEAVDAFAEEGATIEFYPHQEMWDFFGQVAALPPTSGGGVVPIPYGGWNQTTNVCTMSAFVTDPAASLQRRITQNLEVLDDLGTRGAQVSCKRGFLAPFIGPDGELTTQVPIEPAPSGGALCAPITPPGEFEAVEIEYYRALAREGVEILKNEAPKGPGGRWAWLPDDLIHSVWELRAVKDFMIPS